MKDIIFVNSHPIQYFAPLYSYMNERGVVTKVWYCSDESVRETLDHEFGVDVKWDIPLLEGYEYRFFRNYSWKASSANGFFGLINPGMVREMFRIPKSIIVIYGWRYSTHLLLLLLGKLCGHTICMRNDMPQNQELLKTGWKQTVKHIGLRYVIFPRIDYFLYIGHQNRLFYKSYGLPDSRLRFCPFAVDNDRFQRERVRLNPRLSTLKKGLGIPDKDRIILFTAKYIAKKRPLDLLRAFARLNRPDCWLIMVGEGELRPEMEAFVAETALRQVILAGFVNQSHIACYYAISNVFVMCSGVGENWGLSVNEAMNFNLPLILSDLTGCADDLVQEGSNGYVFRTGNVAELTAKLQQILFENELSEKPSSEHIVNNYSFAETTGMLRRLAT